MDRETRDALDRYRRYRATMRWFVPAVIVDGAILLLFVLVFGVREIGGHADGPVFVLVLAWAAMAGMVLLAVVAVRGSKCPFCQKRVRSYPSREIHCIHCGRNIPEEFLEGR